MFECAKSRGQIRFHLSAICAGKQPHILLHEMEGGDPQEVSDALAKWACGALSLTAMHAADTPEGGLDLPNARAPDGVWPPKKDSNAASLLIREAESSRPHHIARANSYCFHGRGEYCMRPPRKGGKKDQSSGAILRECRMWDGQEATPRQADSPGWERRPLPGIEHDPRGRDEISLGETSAVRRIAL